MKCEAHSGVSKVVAIFYYYYFLIKGRESLSGIYLLPYQTETFASVMLHVNFRLIEVHYVLSSC